MTESTPLPRRRGLLAIPGSVLLICLFLPALRVCGSAEYPVSFPPVYAAYLGGIGMVILALANGRRLLAIGASVTPVLMIATAATFAIRTAGSVIFGVILGLAAIAGMVSVVRAMLRRPPSSRAMAIVVIAQGLASGLWAALLAFDRDGLWGSDLTLAAAIATTIVGIAWYRTTIVVPVALPRATALRVGEPV